jgi:hypothetical protein
MRHSKRIKAVAALASLGLVVAACGDDEPEAESPSETATAPVETSAPTEPVETSAPTEPSSAPVETSAPTEPSSAPTAPEEAVCPSNIVVQTDWWPELEHGGTYQLIGPDGTADAASFSYSGPIQPQYAVGGVETVEIRAGGDAVSFTPVSSLLQTDDDIIFGYINMSDVIKDSASAPTIAVAKTLEKDPQMIMWDPTQNDIQAPEDMAATGAQVLHFDGVAYIDYMVAQGYITADQSNPSYGGAPTEWIAQGGNFFQQGFATNEVYKYENEIEWKDGAPADVSYYTVADIGFDNYAATMAIRADRLEELTPCLTVLVPMLQQAWVDYLADPTPITDKLIEVNETYDTYWTVSAPLNEAGLAILEEEGMAANSPDGTYCSIDADRVQTLYDILQPIYEADGVEIAADPTATYTTQFCEGVVGR